MIPFAMWTPGPWELAIILVLVLVLFGAGKLPQAFSSIGSAFKAFRDAQRDDAVDVTPSDDRKELPGGEAKGAGEVEDAREVEKSKEKA